jgi:hypothetical protein
MYRWEPSSKILTKSKDFVMVPAHQTVLQLYKYYPLVESKCWEEEKEWERRLDNVLKQKVWLNPLADFNDPFERNFKYIADPSEAELDTRLFHHLYDFYRKDTGIIITSEQFKEVLKSESFIQKVFVASNSWINGVFSRHGALCLTLDPSNIPMWAHYAQNHRGYCVIFDLDLTLFGEIMKIADMQNYYKELLEGKEILNFYLPPLGAIFVFTKIYYSDSPPIMHLNECLDVLDDPNKIREGIEYLTKHTVGVKYKKWEYENEYRLVANINSKESGLLELSFLPFLKVKGVIMGYQLTNDEKAIFHKKCHENKNCLYQASCSKTEYKIEINLIRNYSL